MLRVVVRVIVYFQSPIPTKNRAVYSDIFTFEGINKSLRCLHMYYGGYDIKDSVSSCKHWKAHVGTCIVLFINNSSISLIQNVMKLFQSYILSLEVFGELWWLVQWWKNWDFFFCGEVASPSGKNHHHHSGLY